MDLFFTGSLVLKIPWKNLYGSAVEASIEDLYLLVVPNQQVKYNEEKEQLKLQQGKQGELLRIEEAKKKAAEKGEFDNNSREDLLDNLYLSYTKKNVLTIIKSFYNNNNKIIIIVWEHILNYLIIIPLVYLW